jgi:intein/homing endonuclease
VNGELVTIASFFEQSDGVISILPGSQYIKTLVPKQYTTKGFNGASITRKSIRYAMKHRVSKEMYEVCVGSNSIIVTEDHSLIVERNGDLLSIKPADIQYGDLLITKYIQTPNLVPGYEYQKEKNKNSNSFNRISISR